jgi:hypothetical protein
MHPRRSEFNIKKLIMSNETVKPNAGQPSHKTTASAVPVKPAESAAPTKSTTTTTTAAKSTLQPTNKKPNTETTQNKPGSTPSRFTDLIAMFKQKVNSGNLNIDNQSQPSDAIKTEQSKNFTTPSAKMSEEDSLPSLDF